MKKTQLFNTVLNLVSQETEIPECIILSRSRSTDVVDARCILVKMLSHKGMYPSQIATYIKHTPASVRNLLFSYSDRVHNNNLIEIISKRIQKQLETTSI